MRATPGLGRGLRPPHLRNEGAKRPPFMVIAGLKNLALYQPVTGSDEPVTGDLDQLIETIRLEDQKNALEKHSTPNNTKTQLI